MKASEINGDAEKAKMFQKQSLRNGDVVLALDLDYTLAHYKDGLKGLFAITHQLGVPESVTKQVLAATEERNFSLRLFYQILSLKSCILISEEKFLELALPWFKENYVLYDDAEDFLLKYLERVPIVIVTAGDEEFQREKIALLDFFPNETIVVPVGKSKIDALKEIYKRYQKLVVFVDDNQNEFDRIHLDAWFCFPATSYPVRTKRADSPHTQTKSSPKTRTIRSFEELQELSLPRKGVL